MSRQHSIEQQAALRPSIRQLLASLAALIVAFLALNAARRLPGITADLAAVGKVVLLIYLPLLLIRLCRQRPEDFGLRLDRWRDDLKVSLLFALATLPLFVVLYVVWFGLIMDHHVTARLDWSYVRGVTLMILVIGVPEEIFFRGWIQSPLTRRWGHRGPTLLGVRIGPDVWLSAALFALAHLAITFNPATVATFVPGLAFAWMRKRTGSVFGAGLYHGLCNSVVLAFNPQILGG
ncbi:MAG: CPBP family glutamic-type intramembrane protease [Candidatus Alcyoniella australis]|nr:CPBP family glutamic-type intramembrane protease [Candidatus Alcyoniella australis]